MRRLYLCNTPYQIILAILLASQLKKCEKDTSDIIVTDNFVQSSTIVCSISDSGFFKNTYYAQINKVLFPKDFIGKIKKCKDFLLIKNNVQKFIEPKLKGNYDEFFYNNDDLFMYSLVSILTDNNPEIRVYRFEEGYSTYINPWCSLRGKWLWKLRNKIYLKKCYDDVFCGLYVFEPSLLLYKLKAPVLTIERQISMQCKELICKIFKVDTIYKDLNERWIIFEESFYQDSNYNFDLELYKKVISLLGKHDVVVKMHPRSKIDRFSEQGIHTIRSDGIPWEAVLISDKIKNKKYIALASGSIINARLLLGGNDESYLLYKCLEEPLPTLDNQFEDFLKKYISMKGQKGIVVPDSWKTLQTVLVGAMKCLN